VIVGSNGVEGEFGVSIVVSAAKATEDRSNCWIDRSAGSMVGDFESEC